MALKNFKRAFDRTKAYLVLSVDEAGNDYNELTIIDSEKTEVKKSKMDVTKTPDLKKTLKASDTDLIYDLSGITGCDDRKKGFVFKDPGAAGAQVHVNASNTIIYGNVEVLGVDIKALYMSADKRLIGQGKVDSSRIKNESIQSALEFVNIDGLKGELGCDVNGAKEYSLYYLDLQNKVTAEDVANAKTAIGNATTEEKKKAAKKYLNVAKAYLRSVEEEKLTAELEGAKKSVKEAQEMEENQGPSEDSFLESLGIRFKRASLVHYEAQDVTINFSEKLEKLRTDIEGNSSLLAIKDTTQDKK
jgi:hypothetical protein